jgi:metal-sulfur cluster biosynthetic enzyme
LAIHSTSTLASIPKSGLKSGSSPEGRRERDPLTEYSMSEVTKASIEAAIKTYIEPSLGRDLIGAACVKGIEIEGGKVKVGVLLGFPAKGVVDIIAAALKERIAAVPASPPPRWR